VKIQPEWVVTPGKQTNKQYLHNKILNSHKTNSFKTLSILLFWQNEEYLVENILLLYITTLNLNALSQALYLAISYRARSHTQSFLFISAVVFRCNTNSSVFSVVPVTPIDLFLGLTTCYSHWRLTAGFIHPPLNFCLPIPEHSSGYYTYWPSQLFFFRKVNKFTISDHKNRVIDFSNLLCIL
jgi:hypothetical protein